MKKWVVEVRLSIRNTCSQSSARSRCGARRVRCGRMSAGGLCTPACGDCRVAVTAGGVETPTSAVCEVVVTAGGVETPTSAPDGVSPMSALAVGGAAGTVDISPVGTAGGTGSPASLGITVDVVVTASGLGTAGGMSPTASSVCRVDVVAPSGARLTSPPGIGGGTGGIAGSSL